MCVTPILATVGGHWVLRWLESAPSAIVTVIRLELLLLWHLPKIHRGFIQGEWGKFIVPWHQIKRTAKAIVIYFLFSISLYVFFSFFTCLCQKGSYLKGFVDVGSKSSWTCSLIHPTSSSFHRQLCFPFKPSKTTQSYMFHFLKMNHQS